MSTYSLAQRIYSALATDADAESKIRAELKSLSLSIVTDPNKSFELTSSTVNGQSMAGSRTMTNLDRQSLLSIIVTFYDLGGALSSKASPTF